MRFLFIVMLILCLSACKEGVPVNRNASTQPANTSNPATPDRSLVNTPERVPTAGTPMPVVGEVPGELLDDILADAAARASLSSSEINVVRAQEQTWSDGSMGCPQPGQMYTQAQVNGYQVILAAAGEEYDYRAADTGYFILCEKPASPVIPPGTPSS